MFKSSSTLVNRLPGRRKTLAGALAVVGIVAVACGGGAGAAPGNQNGSAQPGARSTTAIPSVTPAPSTPSSESSSTAKLSAGERRFISRAQSQGWKTDFTQISDSLDLSRVLSGGVPRDGIPSIDNPRFSPVSDAPDYLRDDEPVIAIKIDGAGRAYPLSILTWHEIVNDEFQGQPITVTFCPLCNTAIAFPRTLDGQVLDFGVSGNLINSNLIMYDRQTQSWWIQATGKSIAGANVDKQLEFIPAPITSWVDFTQQFPDGDVLLRPTASDRHPVTGQRIARNYDRPPYAGYDNINSSPFLFDGSFDGRLLPLERVAAIKLDGKDVAYPFTFLAENPLINDTIGSTPVVTFFDKGTDSAFETRSGEFSKSGSTAIFERTVDGQTLTFTMTDGVIKDEETGSTWNKFGVATDGELAGSELTAVVHQAHFWFSWAAFAPDTEVRGSLDQLAAS